MSKAISAAEVAKHDNGDSCWVILYGNVYDVTNFLPSHPGGSKVILALAGQDATEEYDPVHPPGTLEAHLPPEARLGSLDPTSVTPQDKPQEEDSTIDSLAPVSLENLLNLQDIENEATKRISHKAWAYYYSAADDLISKSLNNAVYKSILLRPRIFVDCVACSTQTSLLGHRTSLPIFISPAAMARLAHPDGEAGIARACANKGIVQMISQNASQTPEQIVADAVEGQVFGWQLYVQQDRRKSEVMLRRIEALRDRIKFVVLTLDAPVPGKREDDERAKNVGAKLPVRSATKATTTAATIGNSEGERKKEKGGIGAQLFMGTAADLTWTTTLPWLAKHTTLPIILKGIQTHEDAHLASQYSPQVQGILLSNHGGRAADTAPPSIHTLLEIRKYCPEVLTKLQVFVDGGIRRGTDVVKALCLGAHGVGIGRPALFGLGAAGQQGVERVIDILQEELETAMRLLGAGNISELGPHHLNTRAVETQIYDGPACLVTRSGSGSGSEAGPEAGLWTSSKL